MTALAAARNPEMLQVPRLWRTFGVEDEIVIYPGALVALNTDGYIEPARSTGTSPTTLKAVGFATPLAQQLRGGVIDTTALDPGDKECQVDSGVGLLKNSADTDEITAADIGSDCYMVDDQTVARTDGGVAGTAQVTRGDVAFNGTDQVGLVVDVLPTLSVASETDDDTTATKLRNAWNASAQHAAVATASVDLSGAESYIILSFLDGGAAAHTVTAHSPATADVTGITNTTARVAPVAASRAVAGKVWDVSSRGVQVAVGLP